MTATRYSESWAKIERDQLPAELRSTIEQLESSLDGPIAVKHYSDDWIAACFELPVDLPSRGTVDGIDIREVEPVAVLFHRRDHAVRAPQVRADRTDFPSSRLPHVNPTPPGQAPWPCLHRGSLDDWYAEHGITDLLNRVRAWYRDAGRGRLMREGDYFEHTRIVSPSGAMVFSANALDEHVRMHWASEAGQPGVAFAVVKLSTSAQLHMGWNGTVAVQFDWLTYGLPDAKITELLGRWNKLVVGVTDLPKMTIALVCWARKQPNAAYFGSLPSNFAELVDFAAGIGIDLAPALEQYRAADAQKLGGVPIVLGLQRPRPLIGRSSDIEWISFVLIASDDAIDDAGVPKPEATVLALSHRDPFTPKFARDLAALTAEQRPRAILGCGAIGSKLAIHLARSGHPPRLVVDSASLNPHHLARHGLTAAHIGKNKAAAVREEILSLFKHGGDDVEIAAFDGAAADVLHDVAKLASVTEVVDATASASVLQLLTTTPLPEGARVRRIEIADQGRLGILSIEGADRNPRVDDLQISLFDLARTDDDIAAWLARHREETEHQRGPVLEEIGLGVGCSSTTMRLRDEIVALHAAGFAMRLTEQTALDGGELFLMRLGADGLFDIRATRTAVPPVTVLQASGEVGWTVRVQRAAQTKMQELLHAHGRDEVGGLLVGLVHRKRKTIYVTDALKPSRGSKGTPSRFLRGVGEYPDAVRNIETKTGNLLGYVGEWHTHPHGSPEPSETDRKAVREIAATLRPAGLPAHVLIVSQQGIRAHVEF